MSYLGTLNVLSLKLENLLSPFHSMMENYWHWKKIGKVSFHISDFKRPI